MGGDRAQAVVAGIAAAAFDAQPRGRKIEFIVKDDGIGKVDAEKPHGFGDRTTAFVHVGEGPEQEHLFAADHRVGSLALKPGAERARGMAPGNGLQGHEADVVAVAGIACAGIAETDEQFQVPASSNENRPPFGGGRQNQPCSR